MDDEPLVREMLRRFLLRDDYVVFEAADSDAAMQILGTTCVGVMLVDRVMPGRDGDWLVTNAHERFPQTAIILATGAYVPSHITTHRGVAGYLSKPFTADAVRNAVGDAGIWHEVAMRQLRRNETP